MVLSVRDQLLGVGRAAKEKGRGWASQGNSQSSVGERNEGQMVSYTSTKQRVLREKKRNAFGAESRAFLFLANRTCGGRRRPCTPSREGSPELPPHPPHSVPPTSPHPVLTARPP